MAQQTRFECLSYRSCLRIPTKVRYKLEILTFILEKARVLGPRLGAACAAPQRDWPRP